MPLLLALLTLAGALSPALGRAQAVPSAAPLPGALPDQPPAGSLDVAPPPPGAAAGVAAPSPYYPNGLPPALEAERQHELQRIDARLVPLLEERHRYSLALPITLIASSFGVAALGCFGVFTLTWESDNENLDVPLYSTVAAIAGAQLITGVVLLAVRIPKRSPHTEEIRELKRQRQQNLDSRFGLVPLPARAAGLALIGRF